MTSQGENTLRCCQNEPDIRSSLLSATISRVRRIDDYFSYLQHTRKFMYSLRYCDYIC